MAAVAASPAEMRAQIIERLVGDTGEPDRVIEAARALALRAVPAIAKGWSEQLSVALTLELGAVELTRFADARPDGEGHAMTVAASASSPDALILAIDPQAMALVVHGLFGGDPDTAPAPIRRDLSPTELDVAAMVFEEIAKAVNGSGNRAFEFRLPLPRAMTGAELRKHILRDGPGVRVVFAVSTPAGAGQIVLTMPQRVLLKHRGDTVPGPGEPKASEWTNRFGEEILRSGVELQATMPLSTMTLGELAQIAVGQVLELDVEAPAQVKLSARRKTLFVCEFGKLGQNYTVRVRQPYDAGQDFIEGLLPA